MTDIETSIDQLLDRLGSMLDEHINSVLNTYCSGCIPFMIKDSINPAEPTHYPHFLEMGSILHELSQSRNELASLAQNQQISRKELLETLELLVVEWSLAPPQSKQIDDYLNNGSGSIIQNGFTF